MSCTTSSRASALVVAPLLLLRCGMSDAIRWAVTEEWKGCCRGSDRGSSDGNGVGIAVAGTAIGVSAAARGAAPGHRRGRRDFHRLQGVAAVQGKTDRGVMRRRVLAVAILAMLLVSSSAWSGAATEEVSQPWHETDIRYLVGLMNKAAEIEGVSEEAAQTATLIACDIATYITSRDKLYLELSRPRCERETLLEDAFHRLVAQDMGVLRYYKATDKAVELVRRHVYAIWDVESTKSGDVRSITIEPLKMGEVISSGKQAVCSPIRSDSVGVLRRIGGNIEISIGNVAVGANSFVEEIIPENIVEFIPGKLIAKGVSCLSRYAGGKLIEDGKKRLKPE